MNIPQRIVAVMWDDAWAGDNPDMHRPLHMITVGLLLQSDKVGVRLATEISEGGEFRGINFIPRKMVVRVLKIAGR